MNDTDAIKSYLQQHKVKRAVIIGAGFIGLEMAENLQEAGAEVAVVEMANQVMAPIDFSMASLVHEHLLQKGVHLYLEKAVASFERTVNGLEVIFKSGERLPADMVLLSIGVRPNTSLATEAGLEIGEMRGIKVNDYLQTSDEHIYAVGDAIEFRHPLTDRPWLNYLAGPANRQARIVADNMVFGNKVTYEGAVGTSIAKIFDMTVAASGLPAKRLKQAGIDYLSATIHSGSHAGYYPDALQMSIKITFSPVNGKLLGAQIVGYNGVDKRIDEFSQVIKHNGTVYDLMALEQAYAPPFSSAKDPVAVAGYVAGNILSGKMKPLYWRELQAADLSKVTLVDVRTPDEFALGALKGAVNIPLDDMRERMKEIPQYGDNRYTVDFDALERRAADPAVKLMLLCNPHNPAGRVWTPEELRRIGDICLRRDILVVADEIHCELVMPGFRYTPFASLSEEFARRSVTCASPSKAFNLAGVQVANIFAADAGLRERIARSLEINETGMISPFAIEALTAAYTDGAEWLDALNGYMWENYLFLRDYFARHLPQFPVLPLEGTYLVWADCRAAGLSSDTLTRRLLDEGRLHVNSGSMYGLMSSGLPHRADPYSSPCRNFLRFLPLT